jgi:predicted Rdx family selenoprotein
VTVNGQQVYSKKATGVFPELNDLKESIQKFLK